MSLLRPIVTAAVLLGLWEAAVRLSGVPPFLLPAPSRVAVVVGAQWRTLLDNGLFTAASMLAGLASGAALGLATALALIASAAARRWLLPLVVMSQALPVFALAPLLVIWLGFELPSKIAMVTLVTYFPVALAFFEGMKRTDEGLLDLGRLAGASRVGEIRHLRAPSALPALASGLRGAEPRRGPPRGDRRRVGRVRGGARLPDDPGQRAHADRHGVRGDVRARPHGRHALVRGRPGAASGRALGSREPRARRGGQPRRARLASPHLSGAREG
jgi:putative hydroxymethylpyrimidine transport system permease protein